MPRSLPNIIITGTPGVGKTTTSEQLVTLSSSTSTPLKHVSINDIAKKHNCYTSYDERLQTHVLDEDALLDEVEKIMSDGNDDGGWIIDYHVCDIFPERWVDLVVVLRCHDTGVFMDRMEKRGYSNEKSQENLDAEIFGIIAEEAKDGYQSIGEEAVWNLDSINADQIDSNSEMILEWVTAWANKGKQSDQEDEEETEG